MAVRQAKEVARQWAAEDAGRALPADLDIRSFAGVQERC